MLKKFVFLILSALVLPLKICLACAVCFGASDPNLARGFYWGVILLGSLPFLLLALFITVVVVSTRKHNHALSVKNFAK